MSGKIAQGAKHGAFRVSLMIEKCGADMLLEDVVTGYRDLTRRVHQYNRSALTRPV